MKEEIKEALAPVLNELQTLHKEQRALRKEQAVLICLVRGKRISPVVKTGEAASILGMSNRNFRKEHVDTSDIRPLAGKTQFFYRIDVEHLKNRKAALIR